MSPRPRLASDTEILMAVFRVVARLGPERLTLADVAEECGLSPAALMKRFGSKRGLLLAAAADAAAGHALIFAGLRARHASPLAALLGLGKALTILGRTPQEVAHSLAFFRYELDDDAFRDLARKGAQTLRRGLLALVHDAVRIGELRCPAPAALARALHAVLFGSLGEYSLHRRGELATFVQRDLRTLLDGYRARAEG